MRVVATIAAVIFVFSACGADDNKSSLSGEDAQLAQALAESFGDPPWANEEARFCIADGMVTGMGGSDAIETKYRLTASGIRAGVEVDSLDEADAEAVAGAYRSCIDVRSLTVSQLQEFEGFSESEANCLADAIGDDVFIDVLVSGLRADRGKVADAQNNLRSARVAAGESCNVEITA